MVLVLKRAYRTVTYTQIYIYIHMYTYVCVCMYLCMHACMHGWLDGWMDGYVCMHVRTYVCMYVCTHAQSCLLASCSTRKLVPDLTAGNWATRQRSECLQFLDEGCRAQGSSDLLVYFIRSRPTWLSFLFCGLLGASIALYKVVHLFTC